MEEPVTKTHSEKERTKSNIFSRFFICWVCPVLYTGNKRDVEEEDLVVPARRYDSDRLGEKLENNWLDEIDKASRENREPSLAKALFRTYWVAYMPGAIQLIINTLCRTVQPLLFAELLSYWSVNSEISQLEAGYYAIGMMALNLVAALASHHNTLFVNRFSLRVKVACSSIIYRKVLRMNQTSLSNVAAGKLVNLLSNDVARFDMAFMFLHYVWLVPAQVAIVAYFLYDAAGYAPFVGLFGVIILILPVQAALTKYTAVIRRKVATRTDKRIKLMSEIINGIQIIKMYAWEKSFQQVVKLARASELKVLGRSICVRSVFVGFMLFAERTTLFITSLMIVISGNMVTATMIYPIRQFMSIIQMNLTFILPIVIASLSELKVSLERMQNVLMMEERPDMAIIPKGNLAQNISFNGKTMSTNDTVITKKYSELEPVRKSSIAAREYAIELSGVNASWTNEENAESLTLKNISIRVKKGKLCAVIGHVGSGKGLSYEQDSNFKWQATNCFLASMERTRLGMGIEIREVGPQSSLLQVLLRELPICGGNLNIHGEVAYACQESWLFPATVRENILFGLPYDAQKYKEVAKVCSLLPDFKQFPYGDLSLVGERGVSLSGGQRARINLARAVYREADVYLLDDPLSAVDANVGRQLFEGCIQGYLGHSTRILVTHQIHFLKAADIIVVLSEGKIKNIGTYDELVDTEVEFTSLRTTDEPKGKTEEVAEKVAERPEYLRGVSKVSVKSDGGDEQKEQILAAEERSTGNLKFAVIWQYFTSVESWCVVLMALTTLLVTQFGATFCDYWLSYWTNQVDEYEQALPEGVEPDPSFDTQTGPLTTALYLVIYGSAVLFVIIMTQVRIQAFVVMTMRASKNLHNNMFKNLLGAVMRFFDTNPSGRVLNRFSKDTGAMDELLPRTILETFQMYLFVLSILVLNALALPFTLVPTAVLMAIFMVVLKWYLSAAQAIKRLEATTKSPVFSMLNSTISGISTIRSSNSQDRLIKTFDDAQDLNSSAAFTFLGASSAFGLYMDILCLVYLGVVIAIFLLVDFGSVVPVGSVGLAISQSMSLTMVLQMAARVTADFLAQMTSVERVLEYTNLPGEENLEIGPTKPPKTWPSDGYLEFKKVDLRYGPKDPPVLKDLNFSIKSGWKVGIVGRTGAGKSSLISALFRLSTIDGSITIDGIDTRGIGKKELRSKISIIPQEPVLFNATLRYNLDPFDQYNDLDIWRALEQVELKDSIPALDFKVSEGGANFSVGQRQLVCLARAILRSNKILIMDEATANVDPQTDGLIQKTIRDQFADCTVLTIAHRLNTIMDSDRILVMDKGSVAEFDHPFTLLSNPNSLLNFMVKETGEQMSDFLVEIARKKYLGENPESSSNKD